MERSSPEASDAVERRLRTRNVSKAVPLHAMVALGGRGGILLLILDLGARWV
jgi:hypothetical protein